MDGEYYVTYRTKCPECAGKGFITHPAWKRFWSEWSDETWREHVCSEAMPEVWLLQDYFGGEVPSQGIECPECNGKGVISRIVPLKDALRDLRVLL